MSHIGTHDFGKLYRAAFAERDLEKKTQLLCEVQQLLQLWQQAEDCQLSSPKLARPAASGISSAA